MFGKFKDKLKGWMKGISKDDSMKVLKDSEDEDFDSEIEDLEVTEKVEEILKEKKAGERKRKEFEVPMKVNTGVQKFEPDLEKIEEKELEILKKIEEDRSELKKLEEAEGDVANKERELEEKIKKDREILKKLGGVNEDISDFSVDKEESIFQRIKSSASGKIKISESDFDKYKDDLEMIFLENNVAVEVVDKILEELKDRMVGLSIPKKEMETNIKITLGEIIEEILVEPFDLVKKIKEKNCKPYVVLFCGINGTGKTTTIAKFASLLKREGVSCVLTAGDTFRAASIEQLKVHGNKLGVPVIAHDYGSDPAAVGFDSIKYAKKNNIDCVLIDTAGRMHTSKNLLAELEKIVRVCSPDSKIFLGESIAGNDSSLQIRAFDEAISIDGIILSKADIDDKGGTALSVGYVTGKPILYLGVGQSYEDLKKFDKLKFVEDLGL